MKKYCVVTTVNSPTKAIEKLYEHFGENLIIVGDEKTPKDWEYKNIKPIEKVDKLYAPKNSYAKKNLGYLEAIQNGAELIYDIDDDTIINEDWRIKFHSVSARVSNMEGWYNIYKIFGLQNIWPRGFALNHLSEYKTIGGIESHFSSIQQGMIDNDTDVDAIWRLVLKREIKFEVGGSIYLKQNSWCPFNSQNTFWFPKAYPLMYLPIYASFRMTDIWRSFVAQRCLWEIGEGITFHSPSEVYQDRNEHDLLKDFEDEIPGYLKNDLIVEILSGLTLKQGEENMCGNLLTCYEVLCAKYILPSMEINSVKQWIKDYENITRNLG